MNYSRFLFIKVGHFQLCSISINKSDLRISAAEIMDVLTELNPLQAGEKTESSRLSTYLRFQGYRCESDISFIK